MKNITLSLILSFALLSTLPVLGQTWKLKLIDPPLPAPAFELIDLDEQAHKLSDYVGKPLIVNFWATWCPPCRAEMPSMERGWQKLQNEGIAMIGINVGEDFNAVFGFTGEVDVSFPLLLDVEGEVTQQWPVRGLPTTYVLNPMGEIVYKAVGGRKWDDEQILNLVRDLKNETFLHINHESK